MQKLLIFLVGIIIWAPIWAQSGCPDLNGDNIFVNEIHYDNGGIDENEGIEIAGPAGTDLSNYRLTLYRGDGTIYGPSTAGGGASLLISDMLVVDTIPNESNGYGTIWLDIDGSAGLSVMQNNGSGIAIYNVTDGNLVQFISYEGAVTGAEGDANGEVSENIPLTEGTSTNSLSSLQLIGVGFCPSDFTWSGPDPASTGAATGTSTINLGQTFVTPTAHKLKFTSSGAGCIEPGELFEIQVCAFDTVLNVIVDTFTDSVTLSVLGAPNGTTQIPEPSRAMVNGCITFTAEHDTAETISFIIDSNSPVGALESDTLSGFQIDSVCEELTVLTSVFNACGDETKNELFSAASGTADIDVADIVLSAVDPENGLQPNVNHSWSVGGNNIAGSPDESCGNVGLFCHRLMDINNATDATVINNLVQQLNTQANCGYNLFRAPSGGTAGVIPASKHVIFFLGAGGNPNALPAIPAGFGNLGIQMDFTGFCGDTIYAVFGEHSFDLTNVGFFSNNATRTLEIAIDGGDTTQITYENPSLTTTGDQIETISSDGTYQTSSDCTPNYLFSDSPLATSRGTLPEPKPRAFSFQVSTAYPNPTQDKVNLDLDLPREGLVRIDMLSMNGQIMYSEILRLKAGSQTFSVQVQNWAEGLYLYRISHEGRNYSGKFLRQGM